MIIGQLVYSTAKPRVPPNNSQRPGKQGYRISLTLYHERTLGGIKTRSASQYLFETFAAGVSLHLFLFHVGLFAVIFELVEPYVVELQAHARTEIEKKNAATPSIRVKSKLEVIPSQLGTADSSWLPNFRVRAV